jgi:hypothetical protein
MAGEVIAGVGLVFSRNRQGIGERYLIDTALLRRFLWGQNQGQNSLLPLPRMAE